MRQELHREDELLAHGGAGRAVAAVAWRQHGVVSAAQLRAAGFGRGSIDLRARQGWLHRVHRGVYAVGHARLAPRGRLWAAVLACGGVEAAVISHRDAAAAWDLRPAPTGKVEVTTLRASRSTGSIRVHRGGTLDRERDVVRQPDGLPVTSVARTLLDLALVLSPHQLERTCHRAQALRLLDTGDVPACLAGGRRPPGARRLQAALATLASDEPTITRSELEDRFLALVVEAGLPRPEANARVAGHEVDFLWRHAGLVAEADGAAWHLNPAAFEEDRRRDAALQVAGYRVVRFTWRQVAREPRRVTATLAALLGRV